MEQGVNQCDIVKCKQWVTSTNIGLQQFGEEYMVLYHRQFEILIQSTLPAPF